MAMDVSSENGVIAKVLGAVAGPAMMAGWRPAAMFVRPDGGGPDIYCPGSKVPPGAREGMPVKFAQTAGKVTTGSAAWVDAPPRAAPLGSTRPHYSAAAAKMVRAFKDGM